MSADVSKPRHPWPFMSPITTTDTEIEAIRTRVLELLVSEGRAIHTGDLAVRLELPTHRIHTAMHHPLLAGKVWFVSSEGWSLPPAADKPASDSQERLA